MSAISGVNLHGTAAATENRAQLLEQLCLAISNGDLDKVKRCADMLKAQSGFPQHEIVDALAHFFKNASQMHPGVSKQIEEELISRFSFNSDTLGAQLRRGSLLNHALKQHEKRGDALYENVFTAIRSVMQGKIDPKAFENLRTTTCGKFPKLYACLGENTERKPRDKALETSVAGLVLATQCAPLVPAPVLQERVAAAAVSPFAPQLFSSFVSAPPARAKVLPQQASVTPFFTGSGTFSQSERASQGVAAAATGSDPHPLVYALTKEDYQYATVWLLSNPPISGALKEDVLVLLKRIPYQARELLETILKQKVDRGDEQPMVVDAPASAAAVPIGLVPLKPGITTHRRGIVDSRVVIERTFKEGITLGDYDLYRDAVERIPAIDVRFTITRSIEAQRSAHEAAKKFYRDHLCAEEIYFIQSSALQCDVQNLLSSKETDLPLLDATVFRYFYTTGVQEDIKRSFLAPSREIAVYGIAGQFDWKEAIDVSPIVVSDVMREYQSDRTQGPQGQLAFGEGAVKTILSGTNLGANGLVHVLDENSKGACEHGYFRPKEFQKSEVFKQLEQGQIEYPCFGFKNHQGGPTVYEMIISSPAGGQYAKAGDIMDGDDRHSLQLLCYYQSLKAQFEAALHIAQAQKRPVVLKVTATGLGVFRNFPRNFAKAFAFLGREYTQALKDHHVRVQLDAFKNGSVVDSNIQQVLNFLKLEHI